MPFRLKTYDYLTFIILAVLAIPSFLILITWNSLPGNKLYPVKRGLEKIALIPTGANFKTEATLRSRLISRRYDEADTLLNKNSTLGLNEFVIEVDTTKTNLIQASQKESPQLVSDQTSKLISQLEQYSSDLETKKQEISENINTDAQILKASTSPLSPSVPKTMKIPPAVNPPLPPANQTPNPVVTEIQETQEKIVETIEELKKLEDQKSPPILIQETHKLEKDKKEDMQSNNESEKDKKLVPENNKKDKEAKD